MSTQELLRIVTNQRRAVFSARKAFYFTIAPKTMHHFVTFHSFNLFLSVRVGFWISLKARFGLSTTSNKQWPWWTLTVHVPSRHELDLLRLSKRLTDVQQSSCQCLSHRIWAEVGLKVHNCLSMALQDIPRLNLACAPSLDFLRLHGQNDSQLEQGILQTLVSKAAELTNLKFLALTHASQDVVLPRYTSSQLT